MAAFSHGVCSAPRKSLLIYSLSLITHTLHTCGFLAVVFIQLVQQLAKHATPGAAILRRSMSPAADGFVLIAIQRDIGKLVIPNRDAPGLWRVGDNRPAVPDEREDRNYQQCRQQENENQRVHQLLRE